MKKTICLVSLALALMTTLSLFGQSVQPTASTQAIFMGKTKPLRETAPTLPNVQSNRREKVRRQFPGDVPNFTRTFPMPTPFEDVALPRGGDPLVNNLPQRNQTFIVEPQLVIEGIDQLTSSIGVPDPAGDVSPLHFIQMTNSLEGAFYQIFDKTGNSVYGPSTLNNLWSQVGLFGIGDPIALWDHDANRWLLTEFADFFNNTMLIALSETEDPLGSYLVYQVQSPDFPDYPKFGVWPNAYYITTNEFSDGNIPVYAIDRAAMLAGENADVQRLGIPKFLDVFAFQVATPVDWDGNTPPPPGSPHYVVRIYDDAWAGGQDKLEMWEIAIDWDNPGNSGVNGPLEFVTAPFESNLCPFTIYECVPQSDGVLLSAIEQVIMNRVPYRNFGTHESIALNFSVDVSGNDRAGIRWIELRRYPGGDWFLYQEGTHSPDEDNSRFIGSLSMDAAGNILLSYSVTGAVEPSLRFTGRLANDPLGLMTIEEYEYATGLSNYAGQRWGDYATMTIDPSNGTDFWFTAEYMKANGEWGTKIGMARIRRDSNDVGPQVLVSPQNSGYLSDAEPVTVAVRNYGYKDVSNIGISYQFNGGAVVNELITDTIPADSTYFHTFVPKVDMSVIGGYDFLLYTSLPIDTAMYNDTLRTRVFQLTRNDAAIVGFEGITPTVCDSSIEVVFLIKNTGVDELNSVQVNWQLNGGSVQTINLEGNLAPGETLELPVTVGLLQNGDNELIGSVNNPNGLPDEDNTNDSRSQNIFAVLGGETVRMELLTDGYPSETTWEVLDDEGNVLYAGGPYTTIGELVEEQWCVDSGCYVLRLYDSFGDGLLGPPPGNVQIFNDEGTLIAGLTVINFGSEIDIPFCTNFQCLTTLSGTTQDESAPGESDGRIILQLENGIPPYKYSIDGGENFQSAPFFFNLSGGIYHCVGRDNFFCLADTIIEIATCTMDLSAEVSGASGAAADGSITVLINEGVPPFEYSLDGVNFQSSNVFTGLNPGEYTVYVRDGSGCDKDFDIDVLVGLDENNDFFGVHVKLYPNPNDGFVRVEIRGLEASTWLPVKVFDSEGRLVRHSRLANYSGIVQGIVSLYDLPAGAYYLQFGDAALPKLYPVLKR